MAREQTIEFLKLLETDEALLDRVREKSPDEVAEIARGLSFDITGEELEAEDINSLGEGGLCLSCSECTFPHCGFGK